MERENGIHESDARPTYNQENEDRKPTGISRRIWFKLIGIAFVFSIFFSLLFGFIGGAVVGLFPASMQASLFRFAFSTKINTPNIEVSRQQIITEDSAVTEVVNNSLPAVVSIMISKNVSSFQSNEMVDPFFGIPIGDGSSGANQSDGSGSQKQVVGTGSGFLITTDGFILTNKHVIEDKQSEFTVIMQDGKQYPVEILAQDPVRDVAVIKIKANGLPILNLGNSDDIKIGQTVIAIGDSLGEFSNSVSRGIVSGLKRNVNATSAFGDTERLTDIIQTDAAINLGNSGGPLLDINGNVIGISVARAQGAENIAFALPINQVKRIVDQARNGTKVSIPYLGVRYVVIDSLVKTQAKLPVDYGVLITRGNKVTDLAVLPGSPADLAGIVENDIILEIDGEKITKDNQLGDIVSRLNVGQNVDLKLWHKGQEKNLQVVLEELKD